MSWCLVQLHLDLCKNFKNNPTNEHFINQETKNLELETKIY